MSKETLTPDDVIQAIQETSSYQDIHLDGHLGSEIGNKLVKLGFKNAPSNSICKVATFEVNLQKDNKRVNIIESNFMGQFTKVQIYVD